MSRQIWSVVARLTAVTLGSYGTASVVTAALSLLLVAAGVTRVEAVLTATLLSFAVYAGLAIWTFQSRTALAAWIGLVVPSLLSSVIIVMLG